MEHLQKRITDTVNQTDAAILSTRGPLGVCQFPSQFWQICPDQMRVYLLVPKTLTMVENLSANSEAFVTTPLWQARGTARVLPPAEGWVVAHTRWCSLVELKPRSIQLQSYAGWEDEVIINFGEHPKGQ